MSLVQAGANSRKGQMGRAAQATNRWGVERLVRPRVLLVALVASLLAVTMGATAASAATRDFSLRYGENVRGNIAFAGNTLIDCPITIPSCNAVGVPAHDNLGANNNNRAVQRVDVDSDPSTETSSRATLTIPAGAQVLFAGLYWAGNPTATYVESDPADVDDWMHPLIETPAGGGYQTVTGTEFDSFDYLNPPFDDHTWNSFADVTDLVRAGGSGQYTVAGVPLRLGCVTCQVSGYGGWTLWVAYSHPAEPWRNLSIFDGLSSGTIQVSGFQTPPSGNFNTAVGVSAIEGDAATTGDQMLINGINLADALTPANNFFNSRIARFAVDQGDRTPNHPNQLGFDTKMIDADAVNPNIIANGATDATVTTTSTGDGYWANAIATAIDIFSPDITVTKEVDNVDRPGAPDARPGEELDYTVTLANASGTASDSATDVVLSDAIPSGTTYVPGSLEMVSGEPLPAGARTDAAGDDSAEYVGADDEVVFRLGDGAGATSGGTVDPGESATISFRVTVNDDTPAGTSVFNTAESEFTAATTGEDLGVPSNEVETPIVSAQADLELTKTAADSTVDPGDPVSWTLTVRNNGPDRSFGSTVTDTLPAGVTNVQTATPGCNVAANTVTCSVGQLASGATTQIVITGNAPSTASICFANDASVDGADDDPVGANNAASATICTRPAADLELTKAAAPVVERGGQVTWTLTVRNTGPDPSTGSTVTDTLPASVTNVQTATPGCNIAGNTVTCDVGPLALDASTDIVITGNAPDTAGTCFENDASVAGDEGDPNAANDVDSAQTCTSPVADLSISKSAPATVEPGGAVTWTIAVKNEGPGDSDGSTVVDSIPAGISNVATPTPGCAVAGGEVRCDVGPLAAGASTSITVTGNAPSQPSTCVDNTATVAAEGGDPVGSNDSATARSCTRPPRHDLSLTKTAPRKGVTVGDTFTYTLTAKNNGPDTATGVIVRDRVPSIFDVVRATTDRGSCAVTGNRVECAVGALANGESAVVRVRVTALRSGEATNSAVVERPPLPGDPGQPPEDPPGNNTGGAKVKVFKPSLRLTKSATHKRIGAGQRVTYAIVVRNPSEATVRNVRTCDDLPAGFVALKASPKVKVSKGRYCWTAKRIPAGKSKRYELTVSALPGAGGRLVNRATATSGDVRGTAQAKRAVRVLGRQSPAGGVTG
jgi:uncharacterized repeat protein (TIGR01451 family)